MAHDSFAQTLDASPVFVRLDPPATDMAGIHEDLLTVLRQVQKATKVYGAIPRLVAEEVDRVIKAYG